MQVIIGGAYNGKTAYVKQLLQGKSVSWYSGEIPTAVTTEFVVLTDFEHLIVPELGELEWAIAIYQQIQALDAQVICICTDMGRGIVPMEKEERFMRDALGRLYQLLLKEAKSVTRVWYGLAETLK